MNGIYLLADPNADIGSVDEPDSMSAKDGDGSTALHNSIHTHIPYKQKRINAVYEQ